MTPFCNLLLALCVSSPATVRAPADSLADRLVRDLTPFLRQRSAAGQFSGVVLVARNGTPIFGGPYGMADRAHGVEVVLDTRFNVGTMHDMWTSVALAQLVEQGLVLKEALVSKYLPDLANTEIRSRMTIRQLLTDSTDAAIRERVIEKISGQSYVTHIKEHVLKRAGMSHSAFLDTRSRPRDVAVGYTQPSADSPSGENWGPLEKHSNSTVVAYATAADLVAFSQAWLSGRLVDKRSTALLNEQRPDAASMYGFVTGVVGGVQFISHSGNAPGVNAEYIAFPEMGIDVVVLANQDPPAAKAIKDRVVSVILGRVDPAVAAAQSPSQSGAATVGTREPPGSGRMGRPAALDASDPRIAPARSVIQQILSGDRAAAEAYLMSHASADYGPEDRKRDLDAIMTTQSPTVFTHAAVRKGFRPNEVIVEVVVAGQTIGYGVSVAPAAPYAIAGVRLLVMMIR